MRRSPFLLLSLLLGGMIAAGSLAPAAPADAPKTAPHASTDAVKKELSDVIDAQLAAFRAGDYAKAYTFAASSIRDMFPPENFAAMVQTGYPVIAHSVRADYGLSFDTGEDAVIHVQIEDGKKTSREFQYLLKKEDGGWKIGGVSEVKSTDLSV